MGISIRPCDSEPDRKQIIITGRHFRDLVDDGIDALLAHHTLLYCYRNHLVEVSLNDTGALVINLLSLASLRGHLARKGDWVRLNKNGDLVRSGPPREVVETILASPERFPILHGITTIPPFGSDGRLILIEGYQAESRWFYAPLDPPIPWVPDKPAPQDVEAALWWLHEWHGDFPFVDEASRTHAIAMELTTGARTFIRGLIPLLVIDAPDRGSGKTLLADTAGFIMAGRHPIITPYITDGGELRRQFTAALSAGDVDEIVFDNARDVVDSPILSAFLTAPEWSDRIVGSSHLARLPNRLIPVLTGNNVSLGKDIVRRAVLCRLDPGVERPWERGGFNHSPLLPWVEKHRHELVWAVLVLVQHWLCIGRPKWSGGPPFGSYEGWSETVGGILEAAGIPGFLENRALLYERVTPAAEAEWASLMGVWWEVHQEHEVLASDLHRLVVEEKLLPSMGFGQPGKEHSDKTRLGIALQQRRDQRYGNHFIRSFRAARGGSPYWQLEVAAQEGGERGS